MARKTDADINRLYDLVAHQCGGGRSVKLDVLRDCCFVGPFSLIDEHDILDILASEGWANQPDEDVAEYVETLRGRLTRLRKEVGRAIELFDRPEEMASADRL